MKIMLDTNVIISSILNPNSICDEILNDICNNHQLILCDYIINESYEVAKRKFKNKMNTLDKLFKNLRYKLVSPSKDISILINDSKDQPILNSAISNDIDILISGDKHFLNLNTNLIQIMNPAEYFMKFIQIKL